MVSTATSSASVATDKSAYNPGAPIVVSFANAPGNTRDWIALATNGASPNSFLRWAYTDGGGGTTPGVINGAVTFSPGIATAGNYQVRLFVNGSYGLVASADFTVGTVTPSPPGQASNPNPADFAGGIGLSPTLSWTAGSGATSHRIHLGTTASLGVGDLKAVQAGTSYVAGPLLALTTYYWRVDEVNAQGTTTGAVWRFSTPSSGGPPVIASQPADRNAVLGSNVLFSVTVGGTAPLSYQWRYNGGNVSDGSGIAGSRTAALAIGNVQRHQAGGYAVVVSNSFGAVTSRVAMLTVVGYVQGLVNAASPGSTVQLPAGIFPDHVVIAKNLRLQGAGAGQTVIDGEWEGRVLLIGNNATVSIVGMSISAGDVHELDDEQGGGVKNYGTLALTNCVVGGSFALQGGGIANYGAMTLHGVTVIGNRALIFPQGGSGGGILNHGSLVMNASMIVTNVGGSVGGIQNGVTGQVLARDCTLQGNYTDWGPYGGILNQGTFTLQNSTVSRNFAFPDFFGGGIGNQGSMVIQNSTISSNFCSMWGGGIANSGVLRMTNSTVVFNQTGEAYNYALGGGIYSQAGSTTELKNCLIAGNHLGFGNLFPPTLFGGPDCYGTITSHGYNLIRDTNELSLVGTLTGTILGVDPFLGPLLNNGGSTWTHALLPGSPAIDKGGVSGLTTDQRGASRTVDVPAIANAVDGTDIGAFEVGSVGPAVTTSKSNYGPGESIVITFASAPANALDWIGLANDGAAANSFLRWTYTGGSGGATPGLVNGSVTFTPGLSTPGNYQARLFVNNSYGVIASVNFTVGTAPPPPGLASNPNPADSANGISLNPTLSWTGGSGVTSHRIYLGNALSLGTADLRSNQSGTSFGVGPLSPNTTYYWRVDEVNSQGTTTGTVWRFSTMSIGGPPTIGSQPPDQGAVVGSNAMLSVTASGNAPLSYQWRYNGNNLADGGSIAGARTAALVLGNVQRNQAGGYAVVVSNSFGAVTSRVASLTVVGYVQSLVNAAPSGGTVPLPAGTFPDNVVINKNLRLEGAGAEQTVIDGTRVGRVFWIGNNVTVSMARLTIAGGDVRSTSDEEGGGLKNFGNLSLTNCVVAGNFAITGGGIANHGALTLHGVTVRGNWGAATLGGWAGGINNHGSLVMNSSLILTNVGGSIGGIHNNTNGQVLAKDCTIQGNYTDWGANGGIMNQGTFTLQNSTVYANYAWPDYPGGGIGNHGSMVILNSTISRNISSMRGGGIENYGTLRMTNSTVAFNRTILAYSLALGGGIYSANNSTTELRNCLVAGNSLDYNNNPFPSSQIGGPDGYGTIISRGYNLIGNTNELSLVGTLTGVILGVDPLLGPLQNNGGSTWTHALLPSSPAIDKGGVSGLSIDQRGATRPVDIAALANAGDGSDIGAFEFGVVGPLLTTSKSIYNLNEQIVVTFASAPGNALDWIGLANDGTPANSYLRWVYTDGTGVGTAGLLNGSVTFSPGLATAGNYQVRLYVNNSYGVVATANFTVGTTPPPPGQAIHPIPSHLSAGVGVNPTLSWTPGSGAVSHRVYLGTSSTLGAGDLKATVSGISYSPGTLAALTTYYWRVDEVNAQGTTTGTVWRFSTMSTGGAPVITSQPPDHAAAVGSNVVLSITASGSAPLNYQWRYNGNNLSDVGTIAGSRTASLTIGNAQRNQAGSYAVVVNNSFGSVTSRVAALTVVGYVQWLVNAAPAGGTVQLQAGSFSDNVFIQKNLRLLGVGANQTVIDGARAGRVLLIAHNVNVDIAGLTIAGGDVRSTADEEGGGLKNFGNLSLTNCSVGGNWAIQGGGIANYGSLTLHGVSVIGNRGVATPLGGWAGGIINHGVLVMNASVISTNVGGNTGALRNSPSGYVLARDCTIQGNYTDWGPYGGIYNSGTFILQNSTVHRNYAFPDYYAGGIGNQGSMVIQNSTISSNISSMWGGGIDNSGVLRMTNSTVAYNRTAPAYNFALGAGIYSQTNSITECKNCLIAGNFLALGSAPSPLTQIGGPDCYGVIISHGYNLIQNTSDMTLLGTLTGTLLGVDPFLGPLQNNGGLTWTHALLQGSPAIDKGGSSGLATDQRGVFRPVDVLTIANAFDGSDIGAFEVNAVVPTVTTTKGTYSPGEAIVINFANAPGNALDWIGLAVNGAPANSYSRWVYTDGSGVGTPGRINGTVTFSPGITTPGNYQARLYVNNSFGIVATVNFSVAAGAGTLISD